MQKRVLMLTTGGTIASKQTPDGLAPQLTSDDILAYIPQVREVCCVDTLQVCNIDSTHITHMHWTLISVAIAQHYEDYDGFVVCHGTDTMAYTAAALSYMIQHSAKPIVVTGAQKPISMDSTDARTNLFDSFVYAADDASHDVSIVFDSKVIAGTRAKKTRTKSYNAFSSINYPYLAMIRNGRILRYIPTAPQRTQPSFCHTLHENVFLLKLTPGLDAKALDWVFAHYDGIVIESFGMGGLPQKLFPVFRRNMQAANAAQKLVVMATQVTGDGSDLSVYEVGRIVKENFNVLEAHDMTLEAVITKLMWLLTLPAEGRTHARTLFYKPINHDILF